MLRVQVNAFKTQDVIMNEIVSSELKSLSCDICGSEHKEILGARSYNASTKNGIYQFNHEDAVCLECGFLYSAKVPSDCFLNEYYKTTHIRESNEVEIKETFNEDWRIEIINKYVPFSSTIMEIGANTGIFIKTLRGKGYSAFGIDPLENSSDIEQKAIEHDNENLQATKYDTVLSYFVVEHVPFTREWLVGLKEYLKLGGYLIIEAPAFDKNPLHSLYWEHLKHFTTSHMEALLQGLGFEVLSTYDMASYHFGFTIVAKMIDSNKNEYLMPQRSSDLIEIAKVTYRDAINDLYERDERIDNVVKNAIENLKSHDEGKIFVWGANPIATDIGNKLQENGFQHAEIVDNGESKIGSMHLGFANSIMRPEFDTNDKGKKIFLLCAPDWNKEIAEQIEGYGLSNIEIVFVLDTDLR